MYVKAVFRRKLRTRVYPAEILLPSHAPPEYSDRRTLWNSVEKAELHPKAQLAYSFDIALQNELSMEENIARARQFLKNMCLLYQKITRT